MSWRRIVDVARLFGVACCVAFALVSSQEVGAHETAGDDVYFVATLADVRVIRGALPEAAPSLPRDLSRAVLDGPGTVHLVTSSTESRFGFRSWNRHLVDHTLAIRLPAPRDASGRLFLHVDEGGGAIVEFRVEAGSFGPEARQAFLEAEQRRFAALRDADIPGRAWWRHRFDAAVEAQGPDGVTDEDLGIGGGRASSDLDTVALFTGGRAVAESLQLDRMLPATPTDGDEVPLDTIAGITTPEYDWTTLTAGLAPETDPLAVHIPEDQHAMFFPDFDALVAMVDHVRDQGGSMLGVLGQSAADSATRERLERQLGLPLDGFAAVVGPTQVRSVALTGSDPYLRSGTDVALLFEAEDADRLHAMLLVRALASGAGADGFERTELTLDETRVVHFGTPDRAVDCYLAILGTAVVATNSRVQLERLLAVGRGERTALADLPEYTFFRDRYPRDAPGETALLVLSDATIRRWCGPRWRIASARRTRAAAALAELQARLVEVPVAEARVLADPPPGLGRVTLSPDGPSSSVYGRPAFLTPIVELDLTRVSRSEAELYGRWRDSYQRNWNGVFDPIAVRFDIGPDRLAIDTTVRPLIASSDYREMVALSSGGEIAPGAGDPHDDALFQWTLAIDPQADWLTRETAMVRALFPDLDALSWLGSCVSVFVDDSPFWDELAVALEEDQDTSFFEQELHRVPVALHAEVRSTVLLTSFLLGVRGLVEQVSPGMMRWENGTWAGESYVTVRPTPQALDDVPEDTALHYVATGQGLLVTPDLRLLRHAIDRRVARRVEAAAAQATRLDPPAPAPAAEGLGRHARLHVSGRAFQRLEQVTRAASQGPELRRRSFENLPILNAWKALHPDQDPVAFHRRAWGERLFCPGGGSYRWNDEWQTMESSVYGHPLAPREGPVYPAIVQRVRSFDAGLTFEDDGLRARVELVLDPETGAR